MVAKLEIHIFTLGMTKMDKIRNENSSNKLDRQN